MNRIYFIGAFLQSKFKSRVFVKLDIRFADNFPVYSSYLGKSLRILMYIYSMTNYGELFPNDLIDWLLEAGLSQSQCQMSIYFKYARDGSEMLFYLMLMTVSIGILLKLL